jgi:hypothetical protein
VSSRQAGADHFIRVYVEGSCATGDLVQTLRGRAVESFGRYGQLAAQRSPHAGAQGAQSLGRRGSSIEIVIRGDRRRGDNPFFDQRP